VTEKEQKRKQMKHLDKNADPKSERQDRGDRYTSRQPRDVSSGTDRKDRKREMYRYRR
jgi:hypothetical protein